MPTLTNECALIITRSTGGIDYLPINHSQVTFTGGARVSTESISIISDTSTEEREEFTLALESFNLIHPGNGSALEISEQEQSRLMLRPSTAAIIILDDDGKSAGTGV